MEERTEFAKKMDAMRKQCERECIAMLIFSGVALVVGFYLIWFK